MRCLFYPLKIANKALFLHWIFFFFYQLQIIVLVIYYKQNFTYILLSLDLSGKQEETFGAYITYETPEHAQA